LKAPVTATTMAALSAGGPPLALGAGDAGASYPSGALSAGGASAPAIPARPAPRISFKEADTQVRDRVVQTVEKDPDSAARLVKSWIKEA